MREIWVADSETDPFKAGRLPAPFLWGAYNGDTYEEFADTNSFVEFMSGKHVICYAHNGGKFDWHFLLDYLEPFSDITVIAGRIAKFRIGECEFRDSANLIPARLADYQKTEIDYSIFEETERHKPHNWKRIRDYLYDDCRFLYDLVTGFIGEYGLHLTQAGAAVKQWEKLSGEKAPETSAEFYEDLSRFYYGGRVQCFQTGIIERPFKVIDINSAYPFAMVHRHPIGEPVYFDRLPDTREEIARAMITLTAESRGAFPFRGQDKSLYFPADGAIREFHITGHEYLAALDTGALGASRIKEVILFPESVEFGAYVEHFWKLKDDAGKRGDKAARLFAKIFLNSLYGKLAANPANYEEYLTIDPTFIEAAELSEGWQFCAQISENSAIVSRPLEEHKRRYYNVATGASITGFVRAYLWRAICKCEGVLYCDTDSIACEDYGALELGDRLGDWEFEAECIRGGIAGKKLYAFELADGSYKKASKGVRLSAEQILEVAAGGVVMARSEIPTYSLKQGVRFIDREIKPTKSGRKVL